MFAEHPLPVETALEGAHGVRMGARFLRPLLSRAVSKQHQRPDDLIAPLHGIHEAQLQLRKLRCRVHGRPFHWPCRRGAYVAHWTEAVIQQGTTRATAKGSCLWRR